MRNLVYGTVRPIALLAWIPPLVGVWLVGERIGVGTLAACFGAVVSCGFANAFNNLIDRHIDRSNPEDLSVAIRQPMAGYHIVLFLLPIQAITLRAMPYRHVVLALLFYTCFWYSYLLGRIPVLKRVVVAGVISTTAILATWRFNLGLAIWMLMLLVYNLLRESRKDKEDMEEDQRLRFFRLGGQCVDWWVVTAPPLAALTLISCALLCRPAIKLEYIVMALGLSICVWSYIQTRYRYGDYQMRLCHRSPAGRLGVVIANVALMPTFAGTALVLIVLVNTASIAYRSFLPRHRRFAHIAKAHDAALWATIPVVAMLMTGSYQPSLAILSVFIFAGVFVREHHRLSRLQAA